MNDRTIGRAASRVHAPKSRTKGTRDALAFRGVSLRLDDATERRLDMLALRLGVVEGARRSGRRTRAARYAMLRGLELLEAEAIRTEAT